MCFILQVKELLEKGIESIDSCLGNEDSIVYSMILSSISTECTTNRDQLVELMKHTLYVKQAEKLGNASTAASDIVESCLVKLKSINSFSKLNDNEIKLTAVAKAAVNANLDILEAQILYSDLLEASKALILTNKLHLLYLAVPYTDCIILERQIILEKVKILVNFKTSSNYQLKLLREIDYCR